MCVCGRVERRWGDNTYSASVSPDAISPLRLVRLVRVPWWMCVSARELFFAGLHLRRPTKALPWCYVHGLPVPFAYYLLLWFVRVCSAVIMPSYCMVRYIRWCMIQINGPLLWEVEKQINETRAGEREAGCCRLLCSRLVCGGVLWRVMWSACLVAWVCFLSLSLSWLLLFFETSWLLLLMYFNYTMVEWINGDVCVLIFCFLRSQFRNSGAICNMGRLQYCWHPQD